MRFIEDRRVPGLVDVPTRVRRSRVRVVVLLAVLALAAIWFFAPPTDRLARWSTVFAAGQAAPAAAQ